MSDNVSPFTDATLALLWGRVRNLTDGVSSAEQLAANLLGRAFVSAELSGAHASLFTAEMMQTIASELTINGQSIWIRNVGASDLKWVLRANIGPRSGKYVINSKSYDPSQIFHVRTNIDMKSGMGQSDLDVASSTKYLIRSLELHLADETEAIRGYVIPTQAWDQGAVQDALKSLQSKTILLPTETLNLMGSGTAPNNQYEWHQRRLGFDAPDTVRLWYESVRMAALSIMGIPPALATPVDASAMREGWRVYIFTVVTPLARLLEQAADRCGLDISMNFDSLMASDIANRARAYGSLVDGNMPEDEARRFTNLE